MSEKINLNEISGELFYYNPLPILLVNIETTQILKANTEAVKLYHFQNNEPDILFSKISTLEKGILFDRLNYSYNNIYHNWKSIHKNLSNKKISVEISTTPCYLNEHRLLFLTIINYEHIKENYNNIFENNSNLAINQTKFGTFVLDSEMNIIEYDTNSEIILEINKNNLDFKSWSKVFPDNLEEEIYNLKYKLNTNIQIYNKEIELVTKLQSKKILFHFTILHKNKLIICNIIDISHREKVFQEMKENQLFIQKINEQSPNIIYIFDIEKDKNTFINKDLRKILGYQETDFEDDSIEIVNLLIHPEDIKQFYEYNNTTKSWEEEYTHSFNMRLKAKDGKWRWFLGYEKEFQRKNNKILSTIGVLTDITDYKEAQNIIIDNTNKLSEAQKLAKLAYWEINHITNEMTGSDEIFNIFEIPKITTPVSIEMFFNFVHKDDLEFVSSAFTNHLVNNAEFYIEHRITLLNGKIKHVLEQCQTIKDELGNNIRSLGIVMDITDRVSSNQKISEQKEQYISLYEEYKAQNEELQKAKEIAEQSNSLKTEFLHNISHEIRTPMNGIVGFAELLANECFDDEKRKFYTKIIIDSSQNLLNIIDNIIEISKLETKQISITETETNINTTLDYIYNVFSLRSKQNNIPLFLKKNINENHSLIFIDNLKLQKVLTNIVDNAFKYTNSGYIELGNNIIENKLHIYIKDTGVGISSSLQNIIFERFKQTKDNVNKKTDGIGLGLAIAKENIELMNGEITVKSELNQGTIFTIILPYKPINNIFPQIQESKISEKYILVAEDEDVNYLFVELLIKKRYPEIKIIHAKNGSEAVDECKKDNNIFLVFLDIKMPILNGFDAAIEILKINNKLPLVALTAYNNDEDRFLADKIGFTDFIPKPIDKIKFYNLINKLLKISTNSQ